MEKKWVNANGDKAHLVLTWKLVKTCKTNIYLNTFYENELNKKQNHKCLDSGEL